MATPSGYELVFGPKPCAHARGKPELPQHSCNARARGKPELSQHCHGQVAHQVTNVLRRWGYGQRCKWATITARARVMAWASDFAPCVRGLGEDGDATDPPRKLGGATPAVGLVGSGCRNSCSFPRQHLLFAKTKNVLRRGKNLAIGSAPAS